MKHKWKKRSGEGYIDTCVLVLCAMLVIALAVKVLPVDVAKQQLDTFAAELVREAEITVTLTLDVDIGFGGLGSFPIELTAQASGRSEVYWK